MRQVNDLAAFTETQPGRSLVVVPQNPHRLVPSLEVANQNIDILS
jgi:hypothetical protein